MAQKSLLSSDEKEERIAGFLFNSPQIHRRRSTPNGDVRLFGKGRFVDDAVENSRSDPLLLAPILREDVMDVDAALKKRHEFNAFAMDEITAAVTHQQGVYRLIGGRNTSTKRTQSGLLEYGFFD